MSHLLQLSLQLVIMLINNNQHKLLPFLCFLTNSYLNLFHIFQKAHQILVHIDNSLILSLKNINPQKMKPIQQAKHQTNLQQNNDEAVSDQKMRLNTEYGTLSHENLAEIFKTLMNLDQRRQRVNELIIILLILLQYEPRKVLQKDFLYDLQQEIKGVTQLSITQSQVIQKKYQQKQECNLQKFKEALKRIKENDDPYFYELQDQLEQFVDKILNYSNWIFVRPIYEPYFRRFLELMRTKIDFISESRLIYQAFYIAQQKIELALQQDYPQSKINGIDDQFTDLLIQNYMQQLQTRSQRRGVCYVRDLQYGQIIPLTQFRVSLRKDFQGYSSWRDVSLSVGQHLSPRSLINNSQKDEVIELFIENTPNIPQPAYECLGCRQYFLQNQNLYQPKVFKHMLVPIDFISQITVNGSLIKDEIVALLNGQGGVILECQKTLNSTVARGSYFIQNEMKEIQDKITDYLKGIHPKPQLKKNIFISWVPIKQDPYLIKQPSNGQDYRLNYLQGLYVCRIIVKPTHGHIAYYWTQAQRPIFSVRKEPFIPSGKIQLSGRSLLKFIKSRFNKYINQVQELDKQERISKRKQPSSFDHVCRQPDQGIKMVFRHKEACVIPTNPEQTYGHASNVIASQQDMETLKKVLLLRSCEYVMKTPFESLRVKGEKICAIFYHHTPLFEDLLPKNTKQFVLGEMDIQINPVTDYVRLTQRNQRSVMTEDEFKTLEAQLGKKYPKEKLRMWKFTNNDGNLEFYLQTDTRESSTYMRIAMEKFSERSTFKNPKGLDRMSKLERKQRLEFYYPLKK